MCTVVEVVDSIYHGPREKLYTTGRRIYTTAEKPQSLRLSQANNIITNQ